MSSRPTSAKGGGGSLYPTFPDCNGTPRLKAARRWCRKCTRQARPGRAGFSWSRGRAVPGIPSQRLLLEPFKLYSPRKHPEQRFRSPDSVREPRSPGLPHVTCARPQRWLHEGAPESPRPAAGLAYLYSPAEAPLIGPKRASLIGPSPPPGEANQNPNCRLLHKESQSVAPCHSSPDILVGISPHPSPIQRQRDTEERIDLWTAERSPHRFRA